MIPCAYLRVFQPLDAFPSAERLRWERYIVGGGRTRTPRPVYRDRSTPPRAPLGLLAPAEEEGADIRMVGGGYLVCPWRTRIRELASLLTLREQTAPEVVDGFVPEAEARRALRELAKLRRRGPSSVPFLLQSPWHVPIRWFVLVADEERRLEGDEVEGFRLSYSTAVPQARKRAERALSVLRRSQLGLVAELVQDLTRWLAAFDPGSLLELDYAGLAGLFTWDELDDDRSARDLADSVDALEAGDLAKAGELYQGVAARWAEVRSHESRN